MIRTNFNDLDANERVVKSKVHLQRKAPFFAHILARSECVMVDTPEIPLAGIDPRGKMYLNKTGIMKIQELKLMGLLAHEILHYVFRHDIRRGSRIPMVWNIATDLTINSILKRDGFQLPDGGLFPDYNGVYKFTVANKEIVVEVVKDGKINNAENIYESIMKQLPKGATGKGRGRGKGKGEGEEEGEGEGEGEEEGEGEGEGDFPQPLDTHGIKEKGRSREYNPKEKQDIEREIRDKVAQAETYARQRGINPLGMSAFIKDILEPKIHWKVELAQYVQKKLTGRLDWKRPHKRTHSVGYYLPRTRAEKLIIVGHIDTSGSMDKQDLGQALTEFQAILLAFPQVKMLILVGDTDIQASFELTQDNAQDIVDLVNLKGGGGTCHQSLFKAMVEDEEKTTKILVCVTDGYTSFPQEEEYEFDTMWLLTPHSINPENVPFGKVIKMERD
jgi:predicted metal-dependent peptidase